MMSSRDAVSRGLMWPQDVRTNETFLAHVIDSRSPATPYSCAYSMLCMYERCMARSDDLYIGSYIRSHHALRVVSQEFPHFSITFLLACMMREHT